MGDGDDDGTPGQSSRREGDGLVEVADDPGGDEGGSGASPFHWFSISQVGDGAWE